MGNVDWPSLAEHATEAFLPKTWVGLGTTGEDVNGALFNEVWWSGYSRMPWAPEVVWKIPANFDAFPIIGETRRDDGGIIWLRVNTMARFNSEGRIVGGSVFPEDRWLRAQDELRIRAE
jgi:hypothetical protein